LNVQKDYTEHKDERPFDFHDLQRINKQCFSALLWAVPGKMCLFSNYSVVLFNAFTFKKKWETPCSICAPDINDFSNNVLLRRAVLLLY